MQLPLAVRIALLACALAPVAAAVGCPETPPPSASCDDGTACAAGLVCQDSLCVDACTAGSCERGLCDEASGLCVDCLTDTDCGADRVCNVFSNRCVDTAAGCTSDADCVDGRCDLGKSACVGCLEDADCGAGQVCDLLTNACAVEQQCVTDGDCSDNTVCEPVQRTCVECFVAAHCASALCDAITNTCVVACVDDDATEPNDGGNALPLSGSSQHQGSICGGDVDEFVFEASGTVAVTLSTSADLALVLTTSTGTLLQTATPSPEGRALTATNLPVATYRLQLRGAQAATEGDYLLDLVITPPAPVCQELDVEPNDDTSTTLTVPTNGQSRSGSICAADVDLWRFTAAQGDDLEARLVAGSGEGPLDIALLNSGGALIGNGDASLTARLTDVDAGTYFVRVRTTAGDRAYTLIVNASAAPPVCVQTDAEPNNTAAQAQGLTAGTNSSGSICAGDVDAWRFSATALDDAAIVVTGAGITARVVRQSDGVEVGRGTNLNLANLQAGSHVVFVEGTSGAVEGTYTVRVTLTPEPAPDPCTEGGIEPDSRTAPRALALDGTQVPGRICAADTDFFRFTVDFNTTVTLRARFSDAAGDLDMRLTDSTGGVLQIAASVTDDELITRALTPGTYFVEMFGFNGALNTYTVEASLQGCTPEDAFEENNELALATPIGTQLISAARCPADDDFFRIRLENGDSLDANLVPTGGAVSFTLLSELGQLIASDTANGGSNRRLQAAALPAGVYVLRVTGLAPARVAYTLQANINANPARCVDDGAEPNNSAGVAFVLDDAGLQDGSYEIPVVLCDGSINADFFAIDLPSDRLVTVSLNHNVATDLDVALQEPQGTSALFRTIASGVATNKLDRISGVLNVGGRFIIRANEFGTIPPTPYTVAVTLADPPATSCLDDRFDTFSGTNNTDTLRAFTNNTATDAVILSAPESLSRLRVCPDNRDFFRLSSLAVGDVVTVNVTYAHAFGRDVDVRLYGPANQTTILSGCTTASETTGTGLLCSSAGIDGSEDLVFTVPTGGAGNHFIEVLGFSAGENFYDLDVSVD